MRTFILKDYLVLKLNVDHSKDPTEKKFSL